MIEALKKYPKTFKKFSEYMSKFDYTWFIFSPEEIDLLMNIINSSMAMPHQFLIGCLIEFVEENGFIIYGGNKIGKPFEESIKECFEVMEERND